MSLGATHIVELTPSGRAAIAVVLVAGPAAVDVVGRCFTPVSERPLGAVPPGRIVLGRWGGMGGEELIICRRAAERMEVHCHGGIAAVRSIVDRLVAEGCTPIMWQDWLRASKSDSVQAAARVALAAVPTARTAAILLDQLQGALASAAQTAIEAALQERWQAAAAAVDRVLAHRDVGQHLTSPLQVVLAGPPNVGKSSLMNALAGFQRAIVSELPGTTRDVVTLSTAIDGWPVQLADTAGLREAGDDLEVAGIGLATGAIAAADLLIVVRDCTTLGNSLPGNIPDALRRTARVLEVVNKIDLLELGRQGIASTSSRLLTSAITGEGIPHLVAAIGSALVPNPPVAGAAVPFTAEHRTALDQARAAIERRDAATACQALQAIVARHSVP